MLGFWERGQQYCVAKDARGTCAMRISHRGSVMSGGSFLNFFLGS